MVLKTVNEIYYYNSHYAYHNDDDDGWITHNYDNDDPTPDNNNKRLIDWEDETSVDYFSDVNSISNRCVLIEGCDHHHQSSSSTSNAITFSSELNQSFTISYSNLMQNAQCAPHSLHPILRRKPKQAVGVGPDNNNIKSFITFISRPTYSSCFENTNENMVGPTTTTTNAICCFSQQPSSADAVLLLPKQTKKEENHAYPFWGLNPGSLVHRTNALTTELKGYAWSALHSQRIGLFFSLLFFLPSLFPSFFRSVWNVCCCCC